MEPLETDDLRASADWSQNKVWGSFFPTTFPNGDFIIPDRNASILNMRIRGNVPSLTKSGKGFIKVEQRSILETKLVHLTGLSRWNVSKFLSNPIHKVERFEEELRGIVDSLLLFDSSIFYRNVENSALLKRLFRKVFTVSSYEVDDVTKQWKEFTNFVWVKASKSKTMETPTLQRGNIFKMLLRNKRIHLLIADGIQNKRDCEALAHLCSTRQLVAGGVRTLETSLKKFIDTTSTPFLVPDVERQRARLAASSVGKKVLGLMDRFPNDQAHISLSGAGSFDTTVKDGGRGQEILQEIKPLLSLTPSEDREIILPYGFSVKDYAGIPRWKTWCRKEVYEQPHHIREWHGEAVFGELRPDRTIFDQFDRRWGFDDALGDQIFICALYTAVREGAISMDGKVIIPIPARSLPIPEPGGKARIVTTTTWWNAILQQPGGHWLRRCLEAHPSAEAGLQRADQAWLYLELLSKVTPLSGAYLLSSDLEEATDATPQDLIYDLIEGFCEGLGFMPRIVRLGLELAASERLIFTSSTVTVKKRGALMGEPLTKAILTILNLSVEEAAIREYLWWTKESLEPKDSIIKPIIDSIEARYSAECGSHAVRKNLFSGNRVSGRVAGLHVESPSPNEFIRVAFRERSLRDIPIPVTYYTNTHWLAKEYNISSQIERAWNAHQTPQLDNLGTDHVLPAVCGYYEGPVQLSWRAYAVGGDDHIAYGPIGYLERITRNHLAWGSKISKTKHGISNCAVRYTEKVLYLEGRDLNVAPKQINRSTEDYERSIFVDSIKVRLLSPLSKSIEVKNDRNIAIGKAKSLGRTLRWLNPDVFKDKWILMVRTRFIRRMKHYLPKEGTGLFYQVLLPEELGGLDLYLRGEILKIFGKVPLPTQQFISKLLRGETNFRILRKFKTFTANGIDRGYDFKVNFAETLETYGPGIDGSGIYDVRDQLGISTDLSLRKLLKVLRSKGWMTFDDLLRESLRGYLFEGILAGIAEHKVFTTTPWRRRYKELWDAVFDEGYVIPFDEIIPRVKDLENVQRLLPLTVYDVNQEIDYIDEVKISNFVKNGIEYKTYPDTVSQRPFIEDLRAELPNLRLSLY